MKEIVKNQNELIKKLKEKGNKKLFLSNIPENNESYFMINDSNFIADDSCQIQIDCCIIDVHNEIFNITSFAISIKLPNNDTYIAFVDFKNPSAVQTLYNIISNDLMKLIIINSTKDCMITFKNPSKKDFLELYANVSEAVKKENYTSVEYNNLINTICSTYTNEEIFNMCKSNFEE